MSRIKLSSQDIIQAIKDKFGSIEDFAKKFDVTDKAVYSRISNQSRQFIQQLGDLGVQLPMLNNNIVQQAGDNAGMTIAGNGNNLKGSIISEGSANELIIEYKNIIKEKNEIIFSKNEEIKKLKKRLGEE
jgi:hypothetical protein